MKMLILPDPHATPGRDNRRADYLANLIIDEKFDYVINLGDHFDMESLSSYDKGKRSFHGRSYRKDIEAGMEFHDRMWSPVKARKKRMPYSIVLEGNHEHRIEKALDLNPELDGTISFKDYGFDDYYDEVVRYDGQLPGVVDVEGVLFAHFFPSGIMGRPIGGKFPARTLLNENKTSCIQGHTHTLDIATTKNVRGETLNGIVAGCFIDYEMGWPGATQRLWRPGVIILDNVENGNFDFRWVSIDSLKRAYDG